MGILAYVAVCAVAGSITWVAVGAVAARGHGAPAAPAYSPIGAASTPSPNLDPTTTPTAVPVPTLLPTLAVTPSPTPAGPFEMDIYVPGSFVSQVSKYECMAGAIQNMLNIIGPKIDTTAARQNTISHILIANTTKTDSLNGGYGPAGWAITMGQLGGGKYKLLIDNSLDEALQHAAAALRKTGRPVGLLSWWGAHSWVMTGFRSDHDPRYYSTYTLDGAFIVDPYYPRHSSIWGQTLGPDTFRDMPAMTHNYIGWKRPEGHYPGRDGKWLLVVPY
jgi:hypothetical protein